MRVNHTAIDTKHNAETQKKWTNNIPSRQERTFFSFTQEACTLPLLAAQHVIHTCTPLKGLHAVQCCSELHGNFHFYKSLRLYDRAGTIQCSTLQTDWKPELYIAKEIKQTYRDVLLIYCSTVYFAYVASESRS